MDQRANRLACGRSGGPLMSLAVCCCRKFQYCSKGCVRVLQCQSTRTPTFGSFYHTSNNYFIPSGLLVQSEFNSPARELLQCAVGVNWQFNPADPHFVQSCRQHSKATTTKDGASSPKSNCCTSGGHHYAACGWDGVERAQVPRKDAARGSACAQGAQ